MLVLVVGPSGAGKDTLLNAARQVFRDDSRVHFARRAITRPADPHGENHEPVTEAEFAAGKFALAWSAHGLRYGIPASALEVAPVTVANVSRGVIAEAVGRFAVRVIEVTAQTDVLAARLAARGREGIEDVARRLAREAAIPAGVKTLTVFNDGTLEEGVERFVGALRACVSAA